MIKITDAKEIAKGLKSSVFEIVPEAPQSTKKQTNASEKSNQG